MKLVTIATLNEEANNLKMLVFAEPGLGKTHLGASASLDELTAPVLFLEYRAQIASLRSNPAYVKAMEEGNLIIVRIEKYTELAPIHAWLKAGRGSNEVLDELMTSCGHGPEDMPKTIVFDSLTELQRAEVMRVAGNISTKFLTSIEPPQIQDWGTLLNQFTTLAHDFFVLPYHVVFMGLETVDYGKGPVGEAPPIEGYRVALQGQAKRQFPAYALTLMRLELAPKGANYFNVGYTRAHKSAVKEQTGMIPAKVLNPTIPMLVNMLMKGGD